MQPCVELTIRYGDFGELHKTVIVPIGDALMRELMDKIERSDEPFSILFASPGMFGGVGNAVTIRRKRFQMRKDIAEKIAVAMVPAMLEAFGVNDELDGYKISGMSEEERNYHKSRGRL